MTYRRCGRSGLRLPAISLGLWHNFGGVDDPETGRGIIRHAFDRGITHFDLANNYGPPPGSAESFFGTVLGSDLKAHRNELVISTKAGYDMWPGPYGDGGSRKYLLQSLDDSLRRLGVDHVDIFYSHRPDRDTPMEETTGALATAVQQGKALYVGISNYRQDPTRKATTLLKEMGVPCLIHQPPYSMFNRWVVEDGLLDILDEVGSGCIAFSPLAQGFTNRYLDGIPADSRAAKKHGHLKTAGVDEATLRAIDALADIATERGQSLAQMALAWVLRHPVMSSVIIGASRISQLDDNLAALDGPAFSDEELAAIDRICADRLAA
jgi:L-glyceraldehyde 3-phosphate reductase